MPQALLSEMALSFYQTPAYQCSCTAHCLTMGIASDNLPMLAECAILYNNLGMKKDFSPETRSAVKGNVRLLELNLRRTALHVPFNSSSKIERARAITPTEEMSKKKFNAIGSLCVGSQLHLPVLDVDGGARTQEVSMGSKLILNANRLQNSRQSLGEYSPNSMLRDVLGDYGIDVEVFTEIGHNLRSPITYKTVVKAIVLRAPQPNVFDTVDSTTFSHSHAFIQEPFSATDHQTLLQELRGVGVTSGGWYGIAQQEGMGVLRTPWTEKSVLHSPS